MVNYFKSDPVWRAKHANTDFNYDDGKLTHSKTTLPDNKTAETDYYYEDSKGGGQRLWKEIEVETDSDGTVTTTEIYHTTLNQGQRHSQVYKDGEYVGSMVGNASKHDGKTVIPDDVIWLQMPEDVTYTGVIPGNPLIDPSFPLVEDEDLKAVTAELIKLNRKVREVITMEIYNFEHVIDFNDKIIFEGNEYFLQSNSVEKSERIVNKQSISIVRWLF